MTPSPKKKPSKPLTAWQLARMSLTELKSDWKRYALILAVIAIPNELISLSDGAGPLAACLLMAIIIMNVALIWAVVQREQTGVIPRPSSAYYDGSVMVVRSIVVILVLAAMAIPAAVGATFFKMSQTALSDTIPSSGEQVLIIVGCLLFAIPTIWLLNRFFLSLIAVVASDLRPLAALKYARRLTLGHFWQLINRYLGLLLLIIIVNIPVTIIAVLLFILRLAALGTIFFGLTTTFIAFPLTTIYLLHLYRDLEPKSNPETPTKTTKEPA